jgi:hypothetical protein
VIDTAGQSVDQNVRMLRGALARITPFGEPAT